ncbi:N-acetylmuramoyl-L-alanine amidase [Neobittarella massiliensis]|uniref:N-acetylmuramoyl-L-alanine amidase n=1 Tax=Neobittarella massiliensis (ex Bilen et al. 2018) TaxID=2041842 RepID=A0A8J6LTT9_9FIRM|nr:N-acetylmuramoyl-L-alanine amidase [Neobittarella massiliensis]MBC3515824.1 N-acetylmuramoyl-L-alanine amidase [Neobittarella massiliensis]
MKNREQSQNSPTDRRAAIDPMSGREQSPAHRPQKLLRLLAGCLGCLLLVAGAILLGRYLGQRQHVHQVTGFPQAPAISGEPLDVGDGVTAALLGGYRQLGLDDPLPAGLDIKNPAQPYTVTEADTIHFYGTASPKVTLKINGVKVLCNARGQFSVTGRLSPGPNAFHIVYKDEPERLYVVVCDQRLLRGVSPAQDLQLSAGSGILVEVQASAKAAVTARLLGEEITLSQVQQPAGDEERSAAGSTFVGMLFVPDDLQPGSEVGRIQIRATAGGRTEEMQGGLVTVAENGPQALPAPPADSYLPPAVDPGQDLYPDYSGSAVAIQAGPGGAAGYAVGQMTNLPSPTIFPLATGTIDFIEAGPLVCSDLGYTDQYYLLRSGTRVLAREVALLGEEQIPANHIEEITAQLDGKDLQLRIKQSWRAPYRIEWSEGGLLLHFYCQDGARPLVELPVNSVFASASWLTGEEQGSQTLALTFGSTGQFRGVSSSYDGQDLVLRFAPVVRSLAGARVYLDLSYSGLSLGGVTDAEVLRGIAAETKAQLETRGAQVCIGDGSLPPDQRVQACRDWGGTLFLQLRLASAGQSAASGCTASYFTPYSARLAGNLTAALSSATPLRDLGAAQGYLSVTRQFTCPAVALSCGHLSDPDDLDYLSSTPGKKQVAAAIADGIYAGS